MNRIYILLITNSEIKYKLIEVQSKTIFIKDNNGLTLLCIINLYNYEINFIC